MASQATFGMAGAGKTLDIIDISGLARSYRLVTLGMYFMMILSILKIPGIVHIAVTEAAKVSNLAVCLLMIGAYTFCITVGWKNLNLVGAVTQPHVIPALTVMTGLSLISVAAKAREGGLEVLMASFDLMAVLAGLGAILAILYLRQKSVPGLAVKVASFLDHGFFQLKAPRLPAANLKLAILFLILGFAWFLALDFLRLELINHSGQTSYALAQAAGFYFLVLARKHLQPDFKTVSTGDHRPPVLFLRSFLDDRNVTEGSRSENIFKSLGFIGYGFFDYSLESRLAAHFSSFGPFIAIGSPQDPSVHLGAVRVQLSDDEWQGRVIKWIAESRLVLVMVGATPWVHWELKRLIEANQMGKTVMVLPHIQKRSRSEIQSPGERLDSLRHSFSESIWAPALAELITRYEAEDVRSLTFEPGGEITVVISEPHSRDSFHIGALISHYLLEHHAAERAGLFLAQPESGTNLASLSTRGIAALIDATVIFSIYAMLQTFFPRTVSIVETFAVVGTLAFVYYWLLEWLTGTTVGKAVLKVEVAKENGQAIGCRASAVRNLMRFVDAIGGYLVGYLFARRTESRQRLGDRAAGTVVRKSSERAWVQALALAGCAVLLAVGFTRDLGGPHVGNVDKVYYRGPETLAKAQAVANVLTSLGFFSRKGYAVHLSEGRAGTILAFPVLDGYWDKPDTLFFYQRMGLLLGLQTRIFPLVIELTDKLGTTKEALNVGRAAFGKDEVYFLGAATQAEAESLGEALRKEQFFRGAGYAVLLSKGAATTLAFPVPDNTWNQPSAVSNFEEITKHVAGSVGGTPIKLEMLNAQLIKMREEVLR